MTAQLVKIFMNGRSQAVRLPKEYRFDSSEVYISRQGNNVIISEKKPDWDDFFNSKPLFDESFLQDREDTSPQERGGD